MKKLLCMFLSVLVMSGAVACVDKSAPTSSVPESSAIESSAEDSSSHESTSDPIIITASDLSQAYETDEKSAQAQYEGKILEISGTVTSVSVLGNIHLDQEIKNDYINCVMTDPEFDPETIQKGDKVRIRGKMADGFLSLKLKQCKFIEIISPADSSSPPTSSTVSSEISSNVSTPESSVPESSVPESTAPESSASVSSAPKSSTEPTAPAEKPQSAMVWITAKGKKYHSSASCSNMKNPYQVTIEEAKASGRTPCSKC